MNLLLPPPGWRRYSLKRKAAGFSENFRVLDPATYQEEFFISRWFGGTKSEIRDDSGAVLYRISRPTRRGPKSLTITDSAGDPAASMTVSNRLRLMERDLTLHLPTQPAWEMAGYPPRESAYRFTSAGRPVMQINVHGVKIIRKEYTLDVADGADTGLALVILWAVTRWWESGE